MQKTQTKRRLKNSKNNTKEKSKISKRKNKREFWTADCETDPFEYGADIQPFIWGVYTGEKYHEFKTVPEFINFVKDKYVKIYFHNGGKFDYFFLINYIEPFSEMLVINGRISKFKIGKAEFLDSFNLIPLPLAAYKKDEFDYSKMRREVRDKYIGEISFYLKNDCVYLYELLQIFFEKYGQHITLASSAFKFWQKESGENKPRTGLKLFNDIHPFYFGGRVQCFKMGIINEPFKVVDINSAYPAAMIKDHPFGQEYFFLNELPKNESEIERSFIHLICNSKGAFPLRTKTGLDFPETKTPQEFFVTGWEYLAAEKIGLISDVKIIDVVCFCETINFKNYVNHFFKIKSEADKSGDKANRLLSKLFLNSLYGRFALNPKNHKKNFIIPSEFLPMFFDCDFRLVREIENDCSIVECDLTDEEKERKYINLAVSASITGYVRAFLLESMHRCKGVLYCDTDSIACKDTGTLPISKKLGEWDIEGFFERGAIAGKKLYCFTGKDGSEKIASKGVKLSGKEIYQIAKGKTVTYARENPSFGLKKKNNTDMVFVVGESAYIKRKVKMQ